MSARTCIASVALALAGLLGGACVATADDFYKGKSINLVVSTDAGTGYDLYARTIARHWPRHIPGTPSINVQNMSGAGGLTATNLFYNVSSKDGLTLGLVQSTVPFESFLGNRLASFDPLKFNWIGTPGQETSTVIVWHKVPVKTIDEARQRGLTLAATGGASTPAFYARVFTELLGVPIKLIVGYKSQSDAFLGMERGENEGSAGTYYSTLKANKADWLSTGQLRILLQYGNAPNPELKGVPFALDLITKPNDRLLMEIASAPLALGRPLLAPPGVPADRIAVLRRSLDETFKDPAYLADCEKQAIACDTALPGEAVADILARTYAAPEEVRARLVKIYSSQN